MIMIKSRITIIFSQNYLEVINNSSLFTNIKIHYKNKLLGK